MCSGVPQEPHQNVFVLRNPTPALSKTQGGSAALPNLGNRRRAQKKRERRTKPLTNLTSMQKTGSHHAPPPPGSSDPGGPGPARRSTVTNQSESCKSSNSSNKGLVLLTEASRKLPNKLPAVRERDEAGRLPLKDASTPARNPD